MKNLLDYHKHKLFQIWIPDLTVYNLKAKVEHLVDYQAIVYSTGMVLIVPSEVHKVQFFKYKQFHLLKYYRPGQPNWENIMWKFHDFSATQILREINFVHFEAPKSAI